MNDINSLLLSCTSECLETRITAYNALTKKFVSTQDEELGKINSENSKKIIENLKDDIFDSNKKVSLEALGFLGCYVANEKLMDLLTVEDEQDILDKLLQLIQSGNEEEILIRGLWSLAQSKFGCDIYSTNLTKILTIIIDILNHEENSVKKIYETLQAVKSLMESVPQDLLQAAEKWYQHVFPYMFHDDIEIRGVAYSCINICKLLNQDKSPLTTLHENTLNLIPQLKSQYCKKMCKFVEEDCNITLKIWRLLVLIINDTLHAGTSLINGLLEVVEKAFKNQKSEFRVDAFKCWHTLISNFSSDKSVLVHPKRLKLLIAPFKSNNAKTEDIAYMKLMTWWFLICQVGDKANEHFDTLVSPLLKFCFNPNSTSQSGSNERFNLLSSTVTPCSKFPSLHIKTVEIFARVLASGHDILLVSDYEFSINELQHPLINNNVLLKNYQLLYRCLEDALMLLDSSNEKQKQLGIIILYSVFKHVGTFIKANMNRKDSIDIVKELFSTFSVIESNCLPGDSMSLFAFKFLDIASNSEYALPKGVMNSRMYHIPTGTKVRDLMNGTLSNFFINKLCRTSLLHYATNNEFIILWEGVLHKSKPSDKLVFLETVIEELKEVVQPLCPHNTHILVSIWSVTAKFLDSHIEDTQMINQGDNSEHDWSCIYNTLLFPIHCSHKYLAEIGHKTYESLFNTWASLWKHFSALTLFTPTAEANSEAEFITRKIIGASNEILTLAPDKISFVLMFFADVLCVIVQQFRFSELGKKKKKLLQSPLKPKRKPHPLHNLSGVVELLDILMEKSIRITSQRRNKIMQKLCTAASKIFDNISVAQMVWPLIQSLNHSIHKALQINPTAIYNREAESKFVEMWDSFCSLIEIYVASKLTKEQLTFLAPLFYVALQSSHSGIRQRTRLLWANAFASTSHPIPDSLFEVLKVLSLPPASVAEIPMDNDSSQNFEPNYIPMSGSPLQNLNKISKPDVNLVEKYSPKIVKKLKSERVKNISVDDMREEDFIKVKSPRVTRRVLTPHQADKMKKRACDIPALYNDMSQSLSQLPCQFMTQDSYENSSKDEIESVNTKKDSESPNFKGKISKASPQKNKSLSSFEGTSLTGQKELSFKSLSDSVVLLESDSSDSSGVSKKIESRTDLSNKETKRKSMGKRRKSDTPTKKTVEDIRKSLKGKRHKEFSPNKVFTNKESKKRKYTKKSKSDNVSPLATPLKTAREYDSDEEIPSSQNENLQKIIKTPQSIERPKRMKRKSRYEDDNMYITPSKRKKTASKNNDLTTMVIGESDNELPIPLDKRTKSSIHKSPIKSQPIDSAVFDKESQPGSAVFDKESQPGSAVFDKKSQPGSAVFDRESQPGSGVFDKESLPGSEAFDKGSVPISKVFDKESQPGSEVFDKKNQPKDETLQTSPTKSKTSLPLNKNLDISENIIPCDTETAQTKDTLMNYDAKTNCEDSSKKITTTDNLSERSKSDSLSSPSSTPSKVTRSGRRIVVPNKDMPVPMTPPGNTRSFSIDKTSIVSSNIDEKNVPNDLGEISNISPTKKKKSLSSSAEELFNDEDQNSSIYSEIVTLSKRSAQRRISDSFNNSDHNSSLDNSFNGSDTKSDKSFTRSSTKSNDSFSKSRTKSENSFNKSGNSFNESGKSFSKSGIKFDNSFNKSGAKSDNSFNKSGAKSDNFNKSDSESDNSFSILIHKAGNEKKTISNRGRRKSQRKIKKFEVSHDSSNSSLDQSIKCKENTNPNLINKVLRTNVVKSNDKSNKKESVAKSNDESSSKESVTKRLKVVKSNDESSSKESVIKSNEENTTKEIVTKRLNVVKSNDESSSKESVIKSNEENSTKEIVTKRLNVVKSNDESSSKESVIKSNEKNSTKEIVTKRLNVVKSNDESTTQESVTKRLNKVVKKRKTKSLDAKFATSSERRSKRASTIKAYENVFSKLKKQSSLKKKKKSDSSDTVNNDDDANVSLTGVNKSPLKQTSEENSKIDDNSVVIIGECKRVSRMENNSVIIKPSKNSVIYVTPSEGEEPIHEKIKYKIISSPRKKLDNSGRKVAINDLKKGKICQEKQQGEHLNDITKFSMINFKSSKKRFDKVKNFKSSKKTFDKVNVISNNKINKKIINDLINHVLSPTPESSKLSPKNQVDIIPSKSFGISPKKSLGNSPLKSLEITPTKSLDITPKKLLEITPSKSLDKIPTKSMDITPTKSPDITSTKSPDITHTKSTEITPTKSLDITPTKSLDITPTKSLDIMPTKLLDITPTKSQDITPTKSQDITLTKSQDDTPTKPLDFATTESLDITTKSLITSPTKILKISSLTQQSLSSKDSIQMETLRQRNFDQFIQSPKLFKALNGQSPKNLFSSVNDVTNLTQSLKQNGIIENNLVDYSNETTGQNSDNLYDKEVRVEREAIAKEEELKCNSFMEKGPLLENLQKEKSSPVKKIGLVEDKDTTTEVGPNVKLPTKVLSLEIRRSPRKSTSIYSGQSLSKVKSLSPVKRSIDSDEKGERISADKSIEKDTVLEEKDKETQNAVAQNSLQCVKENEITETCIEKADKKTIHSKNDTKINKMETTIIPSEDAFKNGEKFKNDHNQITNLIEPRIPVVLTTDSPEKDDSSKLTNSVSTPERKFSSLRKMPRSRAAMMLACAKRTMKSKFDENTSTEPDDNVLQITPTNTPPSKKRNISDVSDATRPWAKHEPSPGASPCGSILKKRPSDDEIPNGVAEMLVEIGEGSPSFLKNRRVSFADPPVSESVEIPPSPKLLRGVKAQKKLDMTKANQEPDIQSDDSQEVFQSTSEPLDCSQPFFPSLVDCEDPVELIAPFLTSPSLVDALISLLKETGLKTVGDFCRISEAELHTLPVRSPKTVTTRKCLKIYIGNKTSSNKKFKSSTKTCDRVDLENGKINTNEESSAISQQLGLKLPGNKSNKFPINDDIFIKTVSERAENDSEFISRLLSGMSVSAIANVFKSLLQHVPYKNVIDQFHNYLKSRDT